MGSALAVGTAHWNSENPRFCGIGRCVKKFIDPKRRTLGRPYWNRRELVRRPFSDRIGPWRYRAPRRSCRNCRRYNFTHPTRRHDVWYYQQYRKSTISSVRKRIEINRMQNPQFYPRHLNTKQNSVLMVHENDFKVRDGFGVPRFVASGKKWVPRTVRRRISLQDRRTWPMYPRVLQ